MGEGLSFLIAEDDDGHATLVQRSIRRAGVAGDLVRLKDGQEVLDYLQRRAPWSDRRAHDGVALLLDLNMPRLSGFDVLRRLKSDHALAHIPIFIMTTTDNPSEIARCYSLGAAVCLVKPVDYGAFGEMVQRLATFLLAAEIPSEELLEAP